MVIGPTPIQRCATPLATPFTRTRTSRIHTIMNAGTGCFPHPAVIKTHYDEHCGKTAEGEYCLTPYIVEAVAVAAEGVGIACRKVHDKPEKRENDDKNEQNPVIAALNTDDIGRLYEVVLARLLFRLRGFLNRRCLRDNAFCVVGFGVADSVGIA